MLAVVQPWPMIGTSEFFMVLGTLAAGLGGFGTLIVSWSLYRLQQRMRLEDRPDVRIWLDTDGIKRVLTIINVGKKTLPIKKMDVPNRGGADCILLYEGVQVRDFLI